MENSEELLTAAELYERERANMPQMIILDEREQYAKDLARHVLDLAPAPENPPTNDDLFATIDHIIGRLDTNSFFTDATEDRAVAWADTLPLELKVAFLTKLHPLVGERNRTAIDVFLKTFWK